MKILAVMNLTSQPTETWQRGLAQASKGKAELLGLVFIEHIEQWTAAQQLIAKLLAEAEQTGIAARGDIELQRPDLNIMAYMARVGAHKLII